ncbi:deoxyguanosinetriphosphate triphosphohydrolase [Pedobacter sp. SYP-B3415]|uniref:deoxyguanosinetriphosphate triphosphohydrolase n=1 Tax=Pedobacter sp. SYP-B3415 TaxID=2496641 RepID=UPI00101E15DA|nr:deoxyguanosinetriphosphate triphosphohydrolase [Pedobacter sp. SYP-B3415]
MEWKDLLSSRRWGYAPNPDQDDDAARSQFQRDYDRLIFSSPFRRLQNKTQVFPLPGSIFVHNRLTHSLEVASVGRSLGRIFYNRLKKDRPDLDLELPLISEAGNIVAAAALAHDIGNPAFGHSGEAAISRYFTDGEGRRYEADLLPEQWSDFASFEGNANALRIMTHSFHGKGNGQFALTYSTLAAIAKYPCSSDAGKQKKILHRKKYGFFYSERETFSAIAEELKLAKEDGVQPIYKRHPLVYLVEAADDICYGVVDLEDAHRLKILSYDEIKSLLLPICGDDRMEARLENDMSDDDAKVSLLRAKAINNLIMTCADVFYTHQDEILAGTFNSSLTDALPEPLLSAWKTIADVSVKKIYNYSSVIQKEVSGYKVMAGLLEEFVPAVVNGKGHYYQKLVKLIPGQFLTEREDTYSKVQSVLDFVSGMTDLYAVELYSKIKGISFPYIP